MVVKMVVNWDNLVVALLVEKLVVLLVVQMALRQVVYWVDLLVLPQVGW